MKMYYLFALSLLAMTATPTYAQQEKNKTGEQEESKLGRAQNMMLNAADESSPRFVNIGLPSGASNSYVMENGMNVTLDTYAQKIYNAFRQDGSYGRPQSLTVGETAIKLGEIGVTMDMKSRLGTDKFTTRMNIGTSSTGKMNGNLSIAGPLKNNFFYHVNAFVNMDPGSTRPSWTKYLDKTFDVKGIITKRYRKGEVSLQYKLINSAKLTDQVCPYIYHGGEKQVSQFEEFKIGTDSYLGNTENITYLNPLTGKLETQSILDIVKATTHAFDIFGTHKFNNGIDFNYSLRAQFSKAGLANYTDNKILDRSSAIEAGTERWVYAGSSGLNGEKLQVYNGTYVQSAQMGVNPPANNSQWQARLELSKKSKKLQWTAGYTADIFSISDSYLATNNYYMGVEANPRNLIKQVYNAKTNEWQNAKQNGNVVDQAGCFSYNTSFFYNDGTQMRHALYATAMWKPMQRLKLNFGARLEYKNTTYNWSPADKRATNEIGKYLGDYREKSKKNDFNKTVTFNFQYNIMKNWGITGEADYIEVTDMLSTFRAANDPDSKKNVVPYLSAGLFLNSKYIDVISRITYIERSNLAASGGFQDPNDASKQEKLSFHYGIKSLGWTTDALVKPFKGAQLHLLMTVQNPKYFDFNFNIFGTDYSYDGRSARMASKFLSEIDPSYSFGKFRCWTSFRYYGKQSASFPATLYFPSRWETFGGIDYQATKKIGFSLSAVNLFGQVGAQGRIVGTNTVLEDKVAEWIDVPVAGTYIRPFSVDLKCKIQF